MLVCMSFLNLLMIVITDEEFWFTGVVVEVLDKKADVIPWYQWTKRSAFPKGIRIKVMLCMAPKVSSPQKKKLKFTPLGNTSQHRFDLEQYLKSFLVLLLIDTSMIPLND
jgi:hypothetical protein